MHVEVASIVDYQDLLLSREADLWPWARVGHVQQMDAKSGLRLTTGWAREIALTISGEKQIPAKILLGSGKGQRLFGLAVTKFHLVVCDCVFSLFNHIK